MEISKIKIRGEKQKTDKADDSTDLLEIRQHYIFRELTRGETVEQHELELHENNLLEFHFNDDTVWICDPGTCDELFPEAARDAGKREDQVFELPDEIVTEDQQQRGIFKKITLKALKVFSKNTPVSSRVMEKAEELEDQMLDKNRGLLWLNMHFEFLKKSVTSDGTYLLLLHGTAASTRTSFGAMYEHAGNHLDLWGFIMNTYNENILAFEHRSLTKSPLENVLELVSNLPRKATLDLMSVSGGGLIGDILCRFCMENSPEKGFSANEKNYLKKASRLNDIELIERIEHVMLDKSIRIRKFVRVACPAGGSTLASKRLDIYLNVLFNLSGIALGHAANPAYAAFKELLAAAVETKDDPGVLPGLEPQHPASPFTRMLNNTLPETELTSPLLVISGNNKPGFRWSAIKAVLGQVFLMGPNDFVVDTDSMYKGARRKDGRAQYFFDESPEVSHFNYYRNEKTRGAILAALESDGDKPVPGFTSMPDRDFTTHKIRNISLVLPGGAVFPREVLGKKPIVVLLPGIMGSNLTVKDEEVWINYLGFLAGRLINLKHDPENNKHVKATSLVGSSYKKLIAYLSSEYDVVAFPFDWRVKMEINALALNSKLLEIMRYNQPVKLIGHSMGGVLIRDFILNHNSTWQKLNALENFRVLFLGAPLGGSFRITSVLFGEDSLIKKLDMIDLENSRKDLLSVFSRFPGIVSLLPLTTDAENNFASPETWNRMKDAFGDQEWPVPDEELLDDFKAYRDTVLDRSETLDLSKAVYIAGQSKSNSETISGYRIVKRNLLFSSRLVLEFLATDEGDDSVTWESGIPKSMIADGHVYYAKVVHGELANDERLFLAISELLREGSTVRLTKNKPVISRGGHRQFKARTAFDFDLSPAGVEKSVLGLDPDQERFTPAEIPVAVTITNGHLKYAMYPLLSGHFENDGILSAERAIDYHLGGELSRRIALGIYPGPIGTSESIESGKTKAFKGGIIVGLGKQGELNESRLVTTIEKGIVKYLADLNGRAELREVQQDYKTKRIGISSLIVGSGYGGLGIEGAARAVLQGVQNANKRIASIYKEAPKVVEAVEFIEVYKDRALACVKAVSQLEKDENRAMNLTGNSIKIQPGWRERLPVEDTQEWWTRISVHQYHNEEALTDTKRRGLRFAISTDAARTEERPLLTDSETLFQIFEEMSGADRWTPELAKVVFEMLIPNDFKHQVKRQNNISWQLDGLTAAFPWELLQDSASNARPLSVNAGMIRQLATSDFRQIVNSITAPFALVIADPDLGNTQLQLKAARKEGEMVSKLLTGRDYTVSEVIFESSARIKINLYGKDYKIVHLAGHGTFSADPHEPSGMVIGENSYLTPADIDQMSGVPELVFVNCCYLGEMDSEADKYSHARYRLAANIGTQLIRIGVKAVVVAGWAVNDDAALEFADKFYQSMFNGNTFGESVKKARKSVYENYGEQNNTWGAYQCYGDPFYILSDLKAGPGDDYSFIIPEEAEIVLSNLLNQLETRDYDPGELTRRMTGIAAGIKRANISNGKIVERQALLYSALGMYKEAIDKFEELIKEENAAFSFSASEQYCTVRARFAMEELKNETKTNEEAIRELQNVIEDLNGLKRFGCTSERLTILGSTYIRLAMISARTHKHKAYRNAADQYKTAYFNAPDHKKYDPLIHWLVIEHALIASKNKDNAKQKFMLPGMDDNPVDIIKKELRQRTKTSQEEINFWDSAAEANLKLCLLLISDKKEKHEQLYKEIVQSYKELWKFTGHTGNKPSEMEYLEFLEDAYSMASNGKAKEITDYITILKEVLLSCERT